MHPWATALTALSVIPMHSLISSNVSPLQCFPTVLRDSHVSCEHPNISILSRFTHPAAISWVELSLISQPQSILMLSSPGRWMPSNVLFVELSEETCTTRIDEVLTFRVINHLIQWWLYNSPLIHPISRRLPIIPNHIDLMHRLLWFAVSNATRSVVSSHSNISSSNISSHRLGLLRAVAIIPTRVAVYPSGELGEEGTWSVLLQCLL